MAKLKKVVTISDTNPMGPGSKIKLTVIDDKTYVTVKSANDAQTWVKTAEDDWLLTAVPAFSTRGNLVTASASNFTLRDEAINSAGDRALIESDGTTVRVAIASAGGVYGQPSVIFTAPSDQDRVSFVKITHDENGAPQAYWAVTHGAPLPASSGVPGVNMSICAFNDPLNGGESETFTIQKPVALDSLQPGTDDNGNLINIWKDAATGKLLSAATSRAGAWDQQAQIAILKPVSKAILSVNAYKDATVVYTDAKTGNLGAIAMLGDELRWGKNLITSNNSATEFDAFLDDDRNLTVAFEDGKMMKSITGNIE